jgi:hypothetical protein
MDIHLMIHSADATCGSVEPAKSWLPVFEQCSEALLPAHERCAVGALIRPSSPAEISRGIAGAR